jgi:hypothetical protein
MKPLARIPRLLALLLAVVGRRPLRRLDADQDRAFLAAKLRNRLSAHLRKDVGAGD